MKFVMLLCKTYNNNDFFYANILEDQAQSCNLNAHA